MRARNLLEKLDLRKARDLCLDYELPKPKPKILGKADYIYESDLDYVDRVLKFKKYLDRRKD